MPDTMTILESILEGPETAVVLEFCELRNPRYTILVHAYLLGQFRIHITDKECPDPGAPAGHGSLVQDLCTYDSQKMVATVMMLRCAADPVALARSLATRENCEWPGYRIRLDTVPGYTIAPDGSWIECETCHGRSYNPNDVRERYCGHCHRFHPRPRVES